MSLSLVLLRTWVRVASRQRTRADRQLMVTLAGRQMQALSQWWEHNPRKSPPVQPVSANRDRSSPGNMALTPEQQSRLEAAASIASGLVASSDWWMTANSRAVSDPHSKDQYDFLVVDSLEIADAMIAEIES